MNIYQFETVKGVISKAIEINNEGKDQLPFAVVSKQMTEPRGRFNKSWHALCEDNLHLAVAFPEPTTPVAPDLPSFMPWFPIELCKELQNIFTQSIFKIKWCNDIYCNGKKISGMFMYREPGCFVVGLGLNVNTSQQALPERFQKLATSLKIETKKNCDMEFITRKVVDSIYSGYRKIESREDFIRDYEKLDYIKGKNILHPIKSVGYGIQHNGSYRAIDDNKQFQDLHHDIILQGEEDLFDVLQETGCHFFCST